MEHIMYNMRLLQVVIDDFLDFGGQNVVKWLARKELYKVNFQNICDGLFLA